MHALDFEFRDHTAFTELLIVTTERRVCRGVLGIVQVTSVFQLANDEFDQSLTVFGIGLHTRPEKSLEFRHRPHTPPESAKSVLVEFVFAIGLPRARKRHTRTLP